MYYEGLLRHTITGSMIDDFLLWAVQQNASDIVLRADDPPWIQIAGIWHPCSASFELSPGETQLLTNYFSGQEHKAGNVQRGVVADFAYSVRIPQKRGLFQRFRVNVTATNCGHYLVLRALPQKLPMLEDLHLERGILEHLYPQNGLVIVSGVMGSGKSTLLAAILHSAICKESSFAPKHARQILTLEQPIEFDFSSLSHHERSAPIAQSEILRHVDSWAEGVRSMTRRKGEIVLVGEARDRETLSSMLQICEQGVLCYATVHANDVPQTLTRIVNAFPEEEKAGVAQILKANLRLIIHQRLVMGKENACGAGRIALREYLPFDEEVRSELYPVPLASLLPRVRALIGQKGQSLAEAANREFHQGHIDRAVHEAIVHEQAQDVRLADINNDCQK